MSQKKLKAGVRQCLANSASTGKRCKRAATAGLHLCSSHEPWVYMVSVNFKPYQRLPKGGFRRHLIAKQFTHKDHAWNWMHDNWEQLTKLGRPGKRFVSASVEAIRGLGGPVRCSRCQIGYDA